MLVSLPGKSSDKAEPHAVIPLTVTGRVQALRPLPRVIYPHFCLMDACTRYQHAKGQNQKDSGHQLLRAVPGNTKMPLLNIVIVLIVVGVALYLINRYIPMASSIKSILNVVVVIAVCVWLLQAVGLWGDVRTFRLTR